MLDGKQQWCPRCQRHVQTAQKQTAIGRKKVLVKIITTCSRCRTTLSSKTARAAALVQKEETASEA